MTGKFNKVILYHDSVQDVALANKVGHKRVNGFVVYFGRRSYLLNFALAHYHNSIAKGQRLFLVVCDIYEGDAQLFVHGFNFHLHVFAHLQVECSQRFVEQQHFGFVHNGTGNSHALLLSARE